MHKVTICSIAKTRAFQGYTPKIWRNKRKRHKIMNMQKLWRRGYNFNVDKNSYHWSLLQEYSLWKGDFISFKSTTHDIIEFNPMFLGIVASHIRPRALIIASFTSMLRISVDCNHRSQPDVWGNNDRKHRIKPLIVHGSPCNTISWCSMALPAQQYPSVIPCELLQNLSSVFLPRNSHSGTNWGDWRLWNRLIPMPTCYN